MTKPIYLVEASIKHANQWAPFFDSGTLYGGLTQAAARAHITKLKSLPTLSVLEFRIKSYLPVITLPKGPVNQHEFIDLEDAT